MPLTLSGTNGVSGVDGSAGTPAVQGTDSNTGIVFGADTISLVEGGTAAFSVDSSANASLVGTLAMGSSFLRNRIINGDMRIAQRGTAAVTVNSTSLGYPVDRMGSFGTSAAGVYTVQQDTDAPAGFKNSIKATVTTADTTLSAGTAYAIIQIIEGNNIADLGWGATGAKTVTVSFWVKSSLTGTFGGSIRNTFSGATASYPFSYTISSASAWEYKTVTITGPTSGTFATDNTGGCTVSFTLGAASDRVGTAGAWGGNLWGPTGMTQVISTNGATFFITGVQLEVGSIATPFERRQYGTELMLCQRYYEVSNSTYLNPQWNGYAASGSNQYAPAFYKVTKRATPGTIVLTNQSNNLFPATVGNVQGSNVDGFYESRTANGTGQTGYFASTFTASAEL